MTASWRWAVAVLLALLTVTMLWLLPELGVTLLIGAALGAGWRARSWVLPSTIILTSPALVLLVAACLAAQGRTPREAAIVAGVTALVLAVAAGAAARFAGMSSSRTSLAAAGVPLFVTLAAAVPASYLPEAPAIRGEVARRFEAAAGQAPARFPYSGMVRWEACLGDHRREDKLSLTYEIADTLEERTRVRGGAGLEQVLSSQMPGGMSIVRDWTEVRVTRSRRDTDLVAYWAGDALRWPLPAATRWVGAIRVPTIRRGDRLLVPAEAAAVELDAPAGCIATTYPRPSTVERGAERDRFVIPVGDPTFSIPAAWHMGQDPYVVSVAAVDAGPAWVAPLVDRLLSWPVVWAGLLIGLAGGLALPWHGTRASRSSSS